MTIARAPRTFGTVTIRLLQAYPGAVFGLRQPGLRLLLQSHLPVTINWQKLDDAFFSLLNRSDGRPANDKLSSGQLWFHALMHWSNMLQRKGSLPVFGLGRILDLQISKDGQAAAHLVTACPPDRPRLPILALKWVEQTAQAILEGTADMQDLQTEMAGLIKQFMGRAPNGRNTIHFLRAADSKHIPWAPIQSDIYQVGWGSRSRWLHSSFTDHTSRIGANFTHDKQQTLRLLKRAGLPVTHGYPATNFAAAKKIAVELGYPVVVKPIDREGGLGVSANIRNLASLERAWNRAQAVSKRFLIEKHVEGQDYRLYVQNGKLLGTLLRIPGGVTGDGQHSIQALLEKENANPDRGHHFLNSMKLIDINEEAEELLSEQGVALGDIPPAGQFIRLRRAANISRGGTPVAIANNVHPDNEQLAIRAANLLRLDIAGIDLLMPDIAISWRDCTAAICEVNAQPQIIETVFPTMHGDILHNMLPRGGRIPLALVIGKQLGDATAEQLAAKLSAAGHHIGLATSKQVTVSGKALLVDPQGGFAALDALLANYDVDAAVLAVADTSLIDTGLPCDRVNAIILADGTITASRAGQSLESLVKTIAPNSHFGIIYNEADAECTRIASALPSGRANPAKGNATSLAAACLPRLIDA